MVFMIGIFNGFTVGLEHRTLSPIWGEDDEGLETINFYTGFTLSIGFIRLSLGRLYTIEP